MGSLLVRFQISYITHNEQTLNNCFHHYIMISEGSCDTEEQSNDAENSG